MQAAQKTKHTDDTDSSMPRTARFRCALVGALLAGKGQEDAIQAIDLLKRAGLDVEVVLVGDGPSQYRRRLEDLVVSSDLQGRVHFTGRVPDSSPAMQSSDVVLMCSRSEAFGRVTIEGMLAGKPVIGTRGGATPELIEDGVTGLLYDFGNPKELSDRIRRLYDDPSLARSLGHNAKTWATQHFLSDESSEQLFSVLKSVLTPV